MVHLSSNLFMGGRIDAIWGLFSSFGGFGGGMVIKGQWSSKSTFGAYNVEAWNNKPKCKWSPQEGGNEEESYLRIEDVLQSRSCDQFSDVLLSRPAAAAQLLDRTHELKERDKSTPRPCGQHAGRKPAPLFPSSPSPACHRRSPPRSVLSSQLFNVHLAISPERKSVACCCKSSPSSEVSPSKPGDVLWWKPFLISSSRRITTKHHGILRKSLPYHVCLNHLGREQVGLNRENWENVS